MIWTIMLLLTTLLEWPTEKCCNKKAVGLKIGALHTDTQSVAEHGIRVQM